MKVKSETEVAQLCPTLSDPMDCSLPGSSVHGIFRARVLEWVAIAFSVLDPTGPQRMSWRVPGVATISLWGTLLAMGNLELANDPIVPVIMILILLMIAPCIINCLTHLVSAQVNKLQHAVPVQQGYIKLHLTTENITHP